MVISIDAISFSSAPGMIYRGAGERHSVRETSRVPRTSRIFGRAGTAGFRRGPGRPGEIRKQFGFHQNLEALRTGLSQHQVAIPIESDELFAGPEGCLIRRSSR